VHRGRPEELDSPEEAEAAQSTPVMRTSGCTRQAPAHLSDFVFCNELESVENFVDWFDLFEEEN
jgi:hypothetical protein